MTTDSELTPGAVDALKNYRRGKRARDRQEWLSKATAIAFVIMVLLLSWYYIAQVSTTAGLRSADATHAAEISSIQDSLKGVCRKVPDPVLSPGQQDACTRAENNVPPAPVIVPGPGGLTTDQVRAIVAAQLANAPAPLTVQEVTDLATSVYTKNPPKDGADATPAMVLAVVSQVCANDACRGPAGAPASQAQVDSAAATAVNVYCAQTSDPCRGTPGTNGTNGAPCSPDVAACRGPMGRSVEHISYAWDVGPPVPEPPVCDQVVEYDTGGTEYVPVGIELCGALGPPPVASPPTT